jgi:hypothetical protein
MVSNFFDNQNQWKYANGRAPGVENKAELDKTKCEKQWVKDIGSVTRFASEEDAMKSKQEYMAACLKKKAEPKGIFKNPQIQQGVLTVQKTFKNPFAEGFKKYVVTADFVGNHVEGEKTKQFKKGMNLFAKKTIFAKQDGSESSNLVSYAGFLLDESKVKEKNPNVYERIQSFFTIKKGF